jgi:hypothetical protein
MTTWYLALIFINFSITIPQPSEEACELARLKVGENVETYRVIGFRGALCIPGTDPSTKPLFSVE